MIPGPIVSTFHQIDHSLFGDLLFLNSLLNLVVNIDDMIRNRPKQAETDPLMSTRLQKESDQYLMD